MFNKHESTTFCAMIVLNCAAGAATDLQSCDLSLLLSNPAVQAANQAFVEADNTYITSERPSLCLMQGEFATINTTQLQLLVGSQDATTCVIAIIGCPVTGVVWAAHTDHPHLGDADVQQIEAALQQMQRPQLYLAGGYCDAPKNSGPQLAQSFLQLLHSLPYNIQLKLCCVGAANTDPDSGGAPRCRQLVLDAATWQPHPWLFTDRGPEVARRFVAQHCRSSRRQTLLPVWDQQQQQLVLGPIDVSNTDAWQLMYYERLVAMPDEQLLQHMSTSPEHEPEWFSQDMRIMLHWLLAAQEPDTPQRRAAATTSRYRLNGCRWELVAGAPAVVHTEAGAVLAADAAAAAVSNV